MKKKILLVEDEALLAMNDARILEKHSYEVVVSHTGENAVEAVDSDPESSLVLMDIDLGKGMDVTEAAPKILERHDLPIVFLTSHSEDEYVDRVKKITKYGYLLKNSGEFVLKESIQRAYQLFHSYWRLQESEQRFQKMLPLIPALISIHDQDMNFVSSCLKTKGGFQLVWYRNSTMRGM